MSEGEEEDPLQQGEDDDCTGGGQHRAGAVSGGERDNNEPTGQRVADYCLGGNPTCTADEGGQDEGVSRGRAASGAVRRDRYYRRPLYCHAAFLPCGPPLPDYGSAAALDRANLILGSIGLPGEPSEGEGGRMDGKRMYIKTDERLSPPRGQQSEDVLINQSWVVCMVPVSSQPGYPCQGGDGVGLSDSESSVCMSHARPSFTPISLIRRDSVYAHLRHEQHLQALHRVGVHGLCHRPGELILPGRHECKDAINASINQVRGETFLTFIHEEFIIEENAILTLLTSLLYSAAT